MGVIIRTKQLKEGYVSLFLDIHFRGQRKYEFLNIKFKNRPSNLTERQIKKEKEDLAKRIALKRETDLINAEYGLEAITKLDSDFFQFFEQYIENHRGLTDIRCFVTTLNKLKQFVGKQKLFCREVNAALLEKFSKNLQANHKGDTPYNYFKKLKRVIKEAVKLKVIKENPSTDIKCPKKMGLEKSVLNFDEIKLLNATYCSNSGIKRAFLLSCLTGLRYCDIKALQWKNIKGDVIELVQQKTKNSVRIMLGPQAIRLIGDPAKPNDLIFSLPTHNGCLKVLATFVKRANITKKITWHCARHSFATNMMNLKTDIYQISKMLGHSSVRCTTRYTRVNDELMRDTVNKFPSIF